MSQDENIQHENDPLLSCAMNRQICKAFMHAHMNEQHVHLVLWQSMHAWLYVLASSAAACATHSCFSWILSCNSTLLTYIQLFHSLQLLLSYQVLSL
jgi:hypothetical protein